MSAREWIFVAIAVLAVYLVFQLIRALQVKDPGAAQSDDVADESVDAVDEDDEDDAEGPAPAAEAATVAPAPTSDESFGLALEIRQLRRDVAQLREELDLQRADIARLRETAAEQASALDAARAAQRVSPIYSEALALAQRGMAAEVIAERCSISVAEAELVQSLATETDDSGVTK
ncbi:MAG: DUF2802 domain-containing protein [Rhodocyclaceae bacterium]|nr:DUF2802 domain-containing protein [Rhodocyclaceae bacterium]